MLDCGSIICCPDARQQGPNVRFKNMQQSNPWIDQQLLEGIQHLD
jgi:hypothetical protein